jgi:hypothetical protein
MMQELKDFHSDMVEKLGEMVNWTIFCIYFDSCSWNDQNLHIYTYTHRTSRVIMILRLKHKKIFEILTLIKQDSIWTFLKCFSFSAKFVCVFFLI